MITQALVRRKLDNLIKNYQSLPSRLYILTETLSYFKKMKGKYLLEISDEYRVKIDELLATHLEKRTKVSDVLLTDEDCIVGLQIISGGESIDVDLLLSNLKTYYRFSDNKIEQLVKRSKTANSPRKEFTFYLKGS